MTQWIIPKTLPSKLSAVPVVDLRATLPVNPSGGWTVINPPRGIAALTDIVLHHDAMSKASTDHLRDEVLIRNIATSHINSKKNRPTGDGGFPYHLFIRNGTVYICNDITTFTYGVASNNSYTVHISVSGNYASVDALTDADRNALYAAIEIAKANMPAFTEIKSHKDLQPTACPGYDVDKVRSDIKEIELSMLLSENLNEQLANVASLYRRVEGLYKTAITQGKYQEEAIRKMNKLANAMRADGLL